MARKKKLSKIVVYGVVTPEDWDDGSQAISIVTDDYEKYGINLDEIGSELMDYSHEPVRVFGYLDFGDSGDKFIRVLDFTPQEYEEEDVWDEGF